MNTSDIYDLTLEILNKTKSMTEFESRRVVYDNDKYTTIRNSYPSIIVAICKKHLTHENIFLLKTMLDEKNKIETNVKNKKKSFKKVANILAKHLNVFEK